MPSRGMLDAEEAAAWEVFEGMGGRRLGGEDVETWGLKVTLRAGLAGGGGRVRRGAVSASVSAAGGAIYVVYWVGCMCALSSTCEAMLCNGCQAFFSARDLSFDSNQSRLPSRELSLTKID